MFNFFKSPLLRMSEEFGQREKIDLEILYSDYLVLVTSFECFLNAWNSIAKTLRYPDSKQMRSDDRLTHILNLNNAKLFHSEFEDSYEILQAIDIKVFHEAIDRRIELNTIKDLVIALDHYSI